MDLPSDLAVHSAPLDVKSLDAPHAGADAGDVHPGGESETHDSPSAAGRVWAKSQIARSASPRLSKRPRSTRSRWRCPGSGWVTPPALNPLTGSPQSLEPMRRSVPTQSSDERRVGKECGSPCRSRWSP